MITLSINGQSRDLDVDPSTPLLWVIRDYAGLTGTKFGCGIAQCGYCHSGQIMAAAALLADTPSPTDADIDEAMSGVVCRCGTYPRIRKGIKRAAAAMAGARATETGDG